MGQAIGCTAQAAEISSQPLRSSHGVRRAAACAAAALKVEGFLAEARPHSVLQQELRRQTRHESMRRADQCLEQSCSTQSMTRCSAAGEEDARCQRRSTCYVLKGRHSGSATCDGLALLRDRSQTCSHPLSTTFNTRVVLAPAQQRCSIHHLAASTPSFWKLPSQMLT